MKAFYYYCGFLMAMILCATAVSAANCSVVILSNPLDHSQYLFLNGTRAMTGNLLMGGYNISNVGTPVAANDACTKAYVDASDAWNASYYLRDTSRSITGLSIYRDLNTQTLSIYGGTITPPYGAHIQLYGGDNPAMSGGMAFRIGNASGEGISVMWIEGRTDTPFLSLVNHQIKDLADPTIAQDAATKHYVDDAVAGGSGSSINESYAYLPGRPGGQVLTGGTGANDDLTLNGTSSGTKTTSYVLIQPDGGNVGIGTTAPTDQLQATGTVRFSNFGAGAATFDANGVISSISDEAMKTNITPFTAGLNEILNITPISFHYTSNSGVDVVNEYSGFSAQNVQASIPKIVFNNSHLSVYDRGMAAAMVNAIKELKTYIDMKQFPLINSTYATTANLSATNDTMRAYVDAHGGGTNDHGLLTNRSGDDQHPQYTNQTYVISVNTSMKSYVDTLPIINATYLTTTDLSSYATTANLSITNDTMRAYVDAAVAGAGSGDTTGLYFLNGTRLLTGKMNVAGFNLTNLSAPVGFLDAATKGYVDALPIINTSYATTANLSATNDTMRAYVGTAIPVGRPNLSAIYPVGSVYITTLETNPNTIFEGFGTWQDLGNGYVLVGA